MFFKMNFQSLPKITTFCTPFHKSVKSKFKHKNQMFSICNCNE